MIIKNINLAQRAENTEIIIWKVEENWKRDGGVYLLSEGYKIPSGRVLLINAKVDSDKYWKHHEESDMRAYDIASKLFGEGNFSGPWHEN